MKKLLGTDLQGNYVFNPASNTITFSGLGQTIGLENILLITNTTANTIIYNFADSTSGAVSFTNNVLTLDYNTSAMSSTDKLQIYVDVPAYEESLHDLLRRMNKLLESNATVDLYQRQKVVIEAVGNARGTPTEAAATIPVSGTVAVSTGSGTFGISSFDIQYPTGSQISPYGTKSNHTTLHVLTGIVDERWRIIEEARTSYATAIRRNLVFS